MTTTGDVDQPSDSVFDVIVIGAGQSGLAIGRQLQQRGRSFLIVDAGPEIGHVWQSRWDSLTLFTAARYSGLPGLPFPGDPDSHPTKDAAAQYLRHYATTFGLPIRHNTRVTRVTRDGAGFTVHTDGETFRATQVVVATGPFQTPGDPGGRGRDRPGHSAIAQLRLPQPGTIARRAGPRRRRCQLGCADRRGTAPDPAGGAVHRFAHPHSAATDSGPRPVLVAHHDRSVHRTGRSPGWAGDSGTAGSWSSGPAPGDWPRPVSPCTRGSPPPTPAQ